MSGIKKKLLILNGSHSEIPLISAGKKYRFHVITTGNLPNLIGHSYSDEYHQADFSNLKKILQLAKKLKIDAICSCANDFGAITASYVSDKLSLPGHDTYDTSLILHHKNKFKAFAAKHDIPTPFAKGYGNYDEALLSINEFTFPLIIKPVDMTGGKGVSKVEEKSDCKKAIQSAFQQSRQKRIVIEEFMDGTQHSLSTFIHNKKVVFYFSDNEYSYLNPYLVSTSAAPSTNITTVSKPLIEASEKIAERLSLVDGVFHIQYLYKNGKAKIIEITRRCSGDFYPYPVNKAMGVNWEDWILKAETGIKCSDFPKVKQKGFCGRHCIMSAKNGIVKNINIDEAIKDNIYQKMVWWKNGDVIDNYLVQKLGVLFLEYKNMEEMLEKTVNINELIKVESA